MDTKILILSDNPETKRQLVQSLTLNSRMRSLAIPTEPGSLFSYLTEADLLILDAPQADLKELRLLKQMRQLSTLPIILLITCDDHRLSVQGLDCGADHVMPKPVNLQELQARVRALMRRVKPTLTEAAGSAPAVMPASVQSPRIGNPHDVGPRLVVIRWASTRSQASPPPPHIPNHTLTISQPKPNLHLVQSVQCLEIVVH